MNGKETGHKHFYLHLLQGAKVCLTHFGTFFFLSSSVQTFNSQKLAVNYSTTNRLQSGVVTLKGASCDAWCLPELHSLCVTGTISPSPSKMRQSLLFWPPLAFFPRVLSSTCYRFRWKGHSVACTSPTSIPRHTVLLSQDFLREQPQFAS